MLGTIYDVLLHSRPRVLFNPTKMKCALLVLVILVQSLSNASPVGEDEADELLEDYGDHLDDKRAGFVGMRGKKDEDLYPYKRAGFVGMRGRRADAEWEQAIMALKRAGFVGMRGKKSSGFVGMRGRRLYSQPTVAAMSQWPFFNTVAGARKSRRASSGFVGMRG